MQGRADPVRRRATRRSRVGTPQPVPTGPVPKRSVPTRLRRVAHSNGRAIRLGIRTAVNAGRRRRATRRSRVGTPLRRAVSARHGWGAQSLAPAAAAIGSSIVGAALQHKPSRYIPNFPYYFSASHPSETVPTEPKLSRPLTVRNCPEVSRCYLKTAVLFFQSDSSKDFFHYHGDDDATLDRKLFAHNHRFYVAQAAVTIET